jgi:hypothetical protein
MHALAAEQGQAVEEGVDRVRRVDVEIAEEDALAGIRGDRGARVECRPRGPLGALCGDALFAAADGIPDNVLIIILVGMALGLCGMGIAFTTIITDARLKRSRHETIRAAPEKGMPIPPELLETPGESSRPREDRRAAIILLALSPGLFVFLWMLGLGAVAYVSVITACIGVARC